MQKLITMVTGYPRDLVFPAANNYNRGFPFTTGTVLARNTGTVAGAAGHDADREGRRHGDGDGQAQHLAGRGRHGARDHRAGQLEYAGARAAVHPGAEPGGADLAGVAALLGVAVWRTRRSSLARIFRKSNLPGRLSGRPGFFSAWLFDWQARGAVRRSRAVRARDIRGGWAQVRWPRGSRLAYAGSAPGRALRADREVRTPRFGEAAFDCPDPAPVERRGAPGRLGVLRGQCARSSRRSRAFGSRRGAHSCTRRTSTRSCATSAISSARRLSAREARRARHVDAETPQRVGAQPVQVRIVGGRRARQIARAEDERATRGPPRVELVEQLGERLQHGGGIARGRGGLREQQDRAGVGAIAEAARWRARRRPSTSAGSPLASRPCTRSLTASGPSGWRSGTAASRASSAPAASARGSRSRATQPSASARSGSESGGGRICSGFAPSAIAAGGEAKHRRARLDVARIEAQRFLELAPRTHALAVLDRGDRLAHGALHRIGQRLRHALRARAGEPAHEIEGVGALRERAHERIDRRDQIVDLLQSARCRRADRSGSRAGCGRRDSAVRRARARRPPASSSSRFAVTSSGTWMPSSPNGPGFAASARATLLSMSNGSADERNRIEPCGGGAYTRTWGNTSSSVASMDRNSASSTNGSPIHCRNAPSGASRLRHEREELAGIEVGCAARPRMRRLRDDHVEARRRERERVARVVQMHVNARIGERVAPAPLGDEAIGLDHLGLELDHVDPLDRRRHHLDRHAAAESHEQQRARLGAREDRERGEPVRRRRSGSRSRVLRHARLGQAVRAQRPGGALIGHEHGGGAADAEIGHRTPRRGRRRPSTWRAGCPTAWRAAPRRARCRPPPRARRRGAGAARRAAPRRPPGRDSIATPAISVPSKPRPGIRKKPAQTEPDDRSHRVRGVDARARGPRGVAAEREHAHRERERRADAQRGREQRDRAGADVGPDRRIAAQLHPVGEGGDPVHDRERRDREARDPELGEAESERRALRGSSRAATRSPRRSRCPRGSSRAWSRTPARRFRRRARSAAPRAPRR